MRLSKF